MNSTNPHSSNFSYQKYSLEQLDNWVNDAVNCEDLTPQDIYETILKCVDESVEYHKKYLTKSVELLSLLKINRSIDFNVTSKDWEDFWSSEQCTEKELDTNQKEIEEIRQAGGFEWTPRT